MKNVDEGVINMHHCGLILEGGGMRGVFTAGVLDFYG
jgi:predicted patatin/cPLA2 family phospholipase